MIGCGGSGQKSVRYIRDAVRRKLEHSNWEDGIPNAWQFIGLDTLNIQESPGEIPTMPASDYKSISLAFDTFTDLSLALLALHPHHERRGYEELIGWRPLPEHVTVPLRSGAGQMRAVGRAAGVVSLATVVRPRLEEAFGACRSGGPELEQISEHLGIPVPPGTPTPDPLVVVLGSMAGGTGAGILLDVVDLVRRTDSRGAFPIAAIFTPDIFNFAANDAMSANGLAMLSELMSAYWDDEISHNNLIPNTVRVDNRGPHSVFLIGRKNLGGSDLKTSQSVYRAVGEAMASWVCSSNVQDSVYNFITVNWPSNASENMGGYPFDHVRQRGVISSFGSATLSIGRDRFREYASKLLMRELLENLYDGHNKKATKELGQDAKSMTDATILEALLSKHGSDYQRACGLDERGSDANQISDHFASGQLAREELRLVKDEMRIPFGAQTGSPSDWHTKLLSQARQVAKNSDHRSNSGFDDLSAIWSSEVYEQVLRASSNYIGRFGLKFAAELVRATVTEVSQAAAELHQSANEDKAKAGAFREEAKSTLRNAGTTGALGFEASPVQSALDSFAKSILGQWRATRRELVAAAMEALSNEVLSILALQINQAHGRVHEYVTTIDGQPAMIATWPTYRGGIPEGFLPSPLEFYLEGPETWAETLERIAGDAMERSQAFDYQATDPIDATRYLINVGGFPASKHTEVAPLVWDSRSTSGSPQWSPGQTAQIRVVGEQEEFSDRVASWMNQPSSPMQRHFSEHLRQYLDTSDANGDPIQDHMERLRSFRRKLDEARNQAQPLIEIDLGLNAQIHPVHPQLTVMPIMQGFPFPTGHPARELVSEVLGDSAYFTDAEAESVLISSFIEYPVHPMVVSSFVKPLGNVLTDIGLDSAQLRGAFWLWRRTKVLQDFIPLPDETRLAMIRGFAIARMLGYITADPSQKVRITGTSGPLEFPFPLLTDVSSDNILPALLEAFGLCFGTVAVQQLNAFDAYERLYKLGESTGKIYVLAEEAETFLRTGVLPFSPEDSERHERAKADTDQERSAKLQEYMKANIQRYETLQSQSFTGAETRDRFGSVDPEDTLSRELVNDLKNAYDAVLNALITRTGGGVV
jgi:hypothetical protein|tara:strand:- start:4184 stop:7486 length:3303 start_codon:yes stop_codon:yes gene_type:complete